MNWLVSTVFLQSNCPETTEKIHGCCGCVDVPHSLAVVVWLSCYRPVPSKALASTEAYHTVTIIDILRTELLEDWKTTQGDTLRLQT
jgi:hypothetical protein